MSNAPDRTTANVPPGAPASPRLVSIDIVRGLAILWVIAFHLWLDLTHPAPGVGPASAATRELYVQFRDRVVDGRPLSALSSLGDLVFGQGTDGVAVFMMLSGLSLTMNAYRRGEPSVLRGYIARFRRVLPVYWAGVLLFVATVAVIALLQVFVDGGSYRDQWFNVRIGETTHVNFLWDDIVWALLVVPWVFRDKVTTIPVGSLWFVELLLQYYLIFPFALAVLRKVGPWYFAAAGLALTIAARSIFVVWPGSSLGNEYFFRYYWSLAPFRASEFFIGMSLGYLLACKRDEVMAWAKSPLDISGLVVAGVMFVTAGVVLEPKGDALLVASEPMVQIGLALLMAPLLFKRPGVLEASSMVRTLVFVGIISLPVLIVHDMMRYVASFLSLEGADGPVWWLFLSVIYVPLGVVLAYPLAKVFGLLPEQRADAHAHDVSSPVVRPRPTGSSSRARAKGARSR